MTIRACSSHRSLLTLLVENSREGSLSTKLFSLSLLKDNAGTPTRAAVVAAS
jgi:hypothetical protein